MQYAHLEEPEMPQATPSSIALATFPDVLRIVLLASLRNKVSHAKVAAELARLLNDI